MVGRLVRLNDFERQYLIQLIEADKFGHAPIALEPISKLLGKLAPTNISKKGQHE